MRTLGRALRLVLLVTVVTGVVYPLLIWLVAQLVFPFRANGSIMGKGGSVVGSQLVGQSFLTARYFQGRPSAVGYDASGSGASNAGPTNPAFLARTRDRLARVRAENGRSPGEPIPADLVLASGSGLDPDLTLDAVLLQVARVARARQLAPESLAALVRSRARRPSLLTGARPLVNILELNRALDRAEDR